LRPPLLSERNAVPAVLSSSSARSRLSATPFRPSFPLKLGHARRPAGSPLTASHPLADGPANIDRAAGVAAIASFRQPELDATRSSPAGGRHHRLSARGAPRRDCKTPRPTVPEPARHPALWAWSSSGPEIQQRRRRRRMAGAKPAGPHRKDEARAGVDGRPATGRPAAGRPPMGEGCNEPPVQMWAARDVGARRLALCPSEAGSGHSVRGTRSRQAQVIVQGRATDVPSRRPATGKSPSSRALCETSRLKRLTGSARARSCKRSSATCRPCVRSRFKAPCRPPSPTA
jgi:hypothetical protein